jgi:hypothetical protein
LITLDTDLVVGTGFTALQADHLQQTFHKNLGSSWSWSHWHLPLELLPLLIRLDFRSLQHVQDVNR